MSALVVIASITVSASAMGAPEPTGLTTTLGKGWNMLYPLIDRAVALTEITGCQFIGPAWVVAGRKWVPADALTSGNLYAVKVRQTCTAHVPRQPVSVIYDITDSKWLWHLFSSTRPWDDMAGSCVLIEGPLMFKGGRWGRWKRTQPMDGLTAHWLKFAGPCRTEPSVAPEEPVAPASLGLSPSDQVSEYQVFDLSGRLRLRGSGPSTSLDTHRRDQQGNPLPNGIYLYVVRSRSPDGLRWQQQIRKVAILR